jgi:hypothetical protein
MNRTKNWVFGNFWWIAIALSIGALVSWVLYRIARGWMTLSAQKPMLAVAAARLRGAGGFGNVYCQIRQVNIAESRASRGPPKAKVHNSAHRRRLLRRARRVFREPELE